MKTSAALALIDKSAPTKSNLEKVKARLEAAYGTIENWSYAVDSAFTDFETSVMICAR